MPAHRPRRRGAPRGNINALKSGTRSSRYMVLMRALLRIPLVRDLILRDASRRARHLPAAERRRAREDQREYIEKFLGPYDT